jgi:hypothetical protein
MQGETNDIEFLICKIEISVGERSPCDDRQMQQAMTICSGLDVFTIIYPYTEWIHNTTENQGT